MKLKIIVGLVLSFFLILIVGCAEVVEEEKVNDVNIAEEEKMIEKNSDNENLELATFAGGCFWCMEAAFEELDGVVEVVSGYSGGEKENPSYEEVLTGKTGHKEAIQVTYNPVIVSYEELLKLFWRQIDPTDDGGQFADRGSQYLTAIFYHNETQKKLAEKSKEDLQGMEMFEKPIVTEIIPFKNFYLAEEYHQDYSTKRNVAYKIYEKGSGRLKFKEEMWGDEE
jgi:peptide methionine sulfoxide reductase msrA/msrB